MTDDPAESTVRSTVLGGVIAGGVSILVLTALTAANVGSSAVRIGVAVVLGVAVAQIYERRIA